MAGVLDYVMNEEIVYQCPPICTQKVLVTKLFGIKVIQRASFFTKLLVIVLASMK